MTKVVVLTASAKPVNAINAHDSVLRQQTNGIELYHCIVVDGIDSNLYKDIPKSANVTYLPFKSGSYRGKNFYGHKIYAHFSQMIDCDYMCFLDDDNTYQPNHVQLVVDKAKQKGFSWSLRRIITESGDYVGEDKFESVCDNKIGYYLIDTSTWCFHISKIQHAQSIEGCWGADRLLTKHMINTFGLNEVKNSCTNKATMNYTAPKHLESMFYSYCKS